MASIAGPVRVTLMMRGKHALDTALLVPQDDARTYALAKGYFYGSLVFIMCSAALFAVLPNVWFASEMCDALSREARLVWPKLDHDVPILEAVASGRGIKYSIFVLYCACILMAGTVIKLPTIIHGLLRGGDQRLAHSEAQVWWKALAGIVILAYFTLFDTGLVGSPLKLGHTVTLSWGVWFWTALLWWMQFMAFGTLVVFTARRLRFGPAGEEWEERFKSRQAQSDDLA